MILASKDTIQHYTDLGVYSNETLYDHFMKNMKKEPDRICVVDPPNRKNLDGFEPERLTYTEFAGAVDAVAEGLVNLGVKKDDIIMVQLPNTWELAMLYLAISRSGAIITPAPVLWREAEMGHIAKTTEARFFITVEEFNGFNHRAMGESVRSNNPAMEKIITLEEIRAMVKGPVTGILDKTSTDPNDIFTICWTSGTEALPKGCPLSHNNWAGMGLLQGSTGMRPGDVMMTAGPLVNMGSIGTVFIPWMVLGGTLVLHHPFDPAAYMGQIMTEKPNYTLMVPALANMIVKHPGVDSFDLTSFRSITIGSAPPSLWTMEEFKKRWDIDIGNIWGQNEGTGFISAIDDVPDMATRATSFPHYGKPGVQWKSPVNLYVVVKLLDPNDREVTEVGEVGELVYKGPGVLAAYFKNPEATERSFTEDGFFRTGDIFRIEENNMISFYERFKDIIIRGGYNISSQEIENYIMGHPKVQDAAIVGMPDEKLGERMCVYVVPFPEQTLDLDEIVDFLNEKGVARYKHPERLEVMENIPRNPVGKILKRTLRQDIKEKLITE
ncbi:MAG: class I adenylate-forming enzyme family protein [Desulfobacterium sp.]|nr:class I adenylate-forming enzyme family protein [Desulfobacterium sp.]